MSGRGGEGGGNRNWDMRPTTSQFYSESFIDYKYIYRYIFFEKKPCISLFVFLDRNRSSFLFKSLDL